MTLAFTLRYSRISSLSCSVIKLANLICLQRHLTVCSRSYETVITYAWRNSSLHSFSVFWRLKCCFWVTHRSTLCRQKCRLQTYIRSIIGRACLSENGSPFSEVGCIFFNMIYIWDTWVRGTVVWASRGTVHGTWTWMCHRPEKRGTVERCTPLITDRVCSGNSTMAYYTSTLWVRKKLDPLANIVRF